MSLAFLGPKGTFCEIAAKAYVARFDKQLMLTPYETIYDVIRAVNDGEVKEGVVPIENSVEGSVTVTLDMLADKDIKVKVVYEIDVDVVHNLIVTPGTKKEEVTEIYSHAQSLAQCQHYLRKNFPKAKTHPVSSNSLAVKMVKDQGSHTVAAIGPEAAAREWELPIMEKAIQDYELNKTRFVAISKNPIRKTKKHKTSIVFSTRKDKPGALYEIMGLFAKNNINLTKIESRPKKQVIGDYLFFIDIEGSDEDPVIETTLGEVGSICSYFKKIGSYAVI
jgi:prephenate dehydratase